MPFSILTGFSGFTEGAPASPAYINAKFSELTQNIASIDAVASTLSQSVFTSQQSLVGWNTGSVTTQVSMGTYPIFVAAGSATTPALAISSETSLGWYRSSTSQMALMGGVMILPVGSFATPALSFSTYTDRGGFYSSATSIINVRAGSLGTVMFESSISADRIVLGLGSSNTVALVLPFGSSTTPAISFSTYTIRGGIFSSNTSIIDFVVGSGGTVAIYSTLSTSNVFIGASSNNTPAILLPRGSATTPAIAFMNASGSIDTIRGIFSSDTSTIDIRAGSGGTVGIHSVLSIATIVLQIVSSLSTAASSWLGGMFQFAITQASGASLGIRSGSTVYWFGSTSSQSLS